ncbi:unnamed protein product [Chrysoparadoxa australica]
MAFMVWNPAIILYSLLLVAFPLCQGYGAGAPKLTRPQLLQVAGASLLSPAIGPAPSLSADSQPEITAKAYLKVRIRVPDVNMAATEVNRLVVGLYGKEAPKSVANFLSYCTSSPAGHPTYRESQITKMEPGELLSGGQIGAMNQVNIAGQLLYEYYGAIIPTTPTFETNQLRHNTRGLFTSSNIQGGPGFSVTLGPVARLDDGRHTVFGRVLEGDMILEQIEELPILQQKSVQTEGSPLDQVFQAQKSASLYVGKKVLKDERAIDRTGIRITHRWGPLFCLLLTRSSLASLPPCALSCPLIPRYAAAKGGHRGLWLAVACLISDLL